MTSNMRLRIKSCTNSSLWYAKHIGETFKVLKLPFCGEWLVVASDGYSNIVKEKDAEVVDASND